MHGDDDNDVDAHDVMKCISGGGTVVSVMCLLEVYTVIV